MGTFSFVEPTKIHAARYLTSLGHEVYVHARFLGLITGLVTQAQRRAAPFLLVHRAIRFGD